MYTAHIRHRVVSSSISTGPRRTLRTATCIHSFVDPIGTRPGSSPWEAKTRTFRFREHPEISAPPPPAAWVRHLELAATPPSIASSFPPSSPISRPTNQYPLSMTCPRLQSTSAESRPNRQLVSNASNRAPRIQSDLSSFQHPTISLARRVSPALRALHRVSIPTRPLRRRLQLPPPRT